MSIQTFQPLIYRRGNLVYHHWRGTSIYQQLFYPFRSLTISRYAIYTLNYDKQTRPFSEFGQEKFVPTNQDLMKVPKVLSQRMGTTIINNPIFQPLKILLSLCFSFVKYVVNSLPSVYHKGLNNFKSPPRRPRDDFQFGL